MPLLGRDVERREPMIVLKVDVTASSNELLRYGRMFRKEGKKKLCARAPKKKEVFYFSMFSEHKVMLQLEGTYK
jgi:hypothetical protein